MVFLSLLSLTESISVGGRIECQRIKMPMPYPNEAQSRLVVKLCSDKSAFEVRSTKQLTLDMSKVKSRLEQSGLHEIVVDTPHIIIVRSDRAETTLSRDGRMLIKQVLNEDEARRVAQRILDAIFEQR